MEEFKLPEQKIGMVPDKGTKYWYLWSCMQTHHFKINETEWVGCMSDLFRFVKGNVYIKRDDAEDVKIMLNNLIDKISNKPVTLRNDPVVKEIEKIEPKKVERPVERIKLTDKEKALQYENNKKRRLKNQKKSPHPDIIV